MKTEGPETNDKQLEWVKKKLKNNAATLNRPVQ